MSGSCFPKNKVTVLPKSSLIKHYGILTLPIFLMIPFGCFGFKPGQFAKGIMAYFINFISIFYLVLFSFLTLHFVFEPKDIRVESHVRVASFFFFTLANFVLLLHKFYRKYNLYWLLEDIVEIRRIGLSKIETFQVFVLFISCLTFIAIVLYTNCLVYVTKMPNFWTLITKDPGAVKILAIIHPVIAVTVQWVSLTCTSLIISFIAVILSAEFAQCNTDLKNEIYRENQLTYMTFSNITKRFYKLKEMVSKVDAMFSDAPSGGGFHYFVFRYIFHNHRKRRNLSEDAVDEFFTHIDTDYASSHDSSRQGYCLIKFCSFGGFLLSFISVFL